ncbi:MAG: class III extradiol dioxygenase subunit B-like domain-containing protein [Clostridia bacterium]|nr:hypothetical protein [Clostridiaceae bacterium]
MIQGVYIMPHPPLMVPGIGDAALITDTIKAAREAADEIAKLKPDTVIVISPHAIVYRDFIYINRQPKLSGSFSNFGRRDIRMTFESDTDLADEIISEGEKEGLPIGAMPKHSFFDEDLDHGTLVPLYFIKEAYTSFKLTVVPIAGFAYSDLYRTGTLLQRAARNLNLNVTVIASADLSHKLTADGPYGFAKEGPLFDAKVKKCVESNDIRGLMTMDESFVHKAAMCGLPSIVMGYGSLDGYELESKVFSYEGPYGVGYMVARIMPKGGKA